MNTTALRLSDCPHGRGRRTWQLDGNTQLQALTTRQGPYRWCVVHDHPIAGHLWRYITATQARPILERWVASTR
jgi:hypothetical protein